MSKTMKTKRVLSMVLVLTMLFSLSIFSTAALAAGPEELSGTDIMGLAQGEHQFQDGVDITSLPSSWSTPSNVTRVTNGLVTMTVDGVETKLEVKTYEGNVALTVTPLLVSGSMTSINRSSTPYRAGLYFDATGLVDAKSVKSAVDMTKVDTENKVIDGVTIKSGSAEANDGGPQFSGLVFNGNIEYTVKNSKIELYSDADGNPNSTNDFVGLGAAIHVDNGAKVTFDNVSVHTTGVARPALVSSAGSYLFKNSSFIVEGGELYPEYVNSADMGRMVAPPWVLGIGGNARGTNLVGTNSRNAFVDSELTATGWGVLSSDSGSGGIISVINSKLKLTGDTGYGIYAIGGATEYFYGCDIDVATYALIMTGGTTTFTSYTGGQEINVGTAFTGLKSETVPEGKAVPTTVKSQFGVMTHNSGTVNVNEKSIFNTKNASFLSKAGTLTLNIDDAVLDSEDGVLIQVIDNDDATVGTRSGATDQYGSYGNPLFNTRFVETAVDEDGWSLPSTSSSRSGGITANITNAALVGDMYNASGFRYTTRNESSGAISTTSNTAAKNMTINLGPGAKLEGVISTTRPAHVWMVWEEDTSYTQGGYYRYATEADKEAIASLGDGREYKEMTADGTTYLQAAGFTIKEHYNLGHVVNDPGVYSAANAAVSLTGDAVWTVTGTCYLTSLAIGGDAMLTAKNGCELVMTVNGEPAEIEAGNTYTGAIVLALVTSEYTVTFDADGGTEVDAQVVEYGDCAEQPNVPEKEGYVFAGWFADGEKFNFATPIFADITLMAKWDAAAEPEPGIKVLQANVENGNGQSNVNFAIKSANGKGYAVLISKDGGETYNPYSNVNYNSKGAHIKGLENGKTYWVIITYTEKGETIESNPVIIKPSK